LKTAFEKPNPAGFIDLGEFIKFVGFCWCLGFQKAPLTVTPFVAEKVFWLTNTLLTRT